MTISALMLVKGDSKRLPNKNVLNFNGKPMFIWNLEKCLELFKRTYVSSDDETILEMAKKAGAIPIRRPKELCGDTPNIPVYQHALSKMVFSRAIVAVQANSPTIKSSIIASIRILMNKCGYSEIMTCCEDYSIYGSVWAISRKKLLKYGDPYKPTPDILIKDISVDIHSKEDLILANKQFYEQSIRNSRRRS